MSSLHRAFARRIQRAGYQQPRRRKSTANGQQSDAIRTMPALKLLKPFQRDVLHGLVEQFIEAKEKAA